MRLQLCSMILMLAAATAFAQNRACQVLTPQEIGTALGSGPASNGIPSPIDGGSACTYRSPGVVLSVSVLDKNIEAQFTRIKARVNNVQAISGIGDSAIMYEQGGLHDIMVAKHGTGLAILIRRESTGSMRETLVKLAKVARLPPLTNSILRRRKHDFARQYPNRSKGLSEFCKREHSSNPRIA